MRLPKKRQLNKKAEPKKKAVKRPKIPAKQRENKVGYKNPPKEYQFPPGQSGNPNGPPVHRIHLWSWFCKFMNLTDTELAKLDRPKLTQAQQTALKLTEDLKDGKYSGSQRLARHVFDREEGKPIEHVVIEQGDILTDEECEEIRETLENNAK
jgi:hypothetical protein